MRNGWQSGFDSLMQTRATMHHNWHHLQNLMNHGANREAAAIVHSFQVQMDFESTENYQHEQRLAS